MHSKIIGLLVLSLISCGYAQVATVVTSLAGCTGATCNIASLNILGTVLTSLTGFGLNFSASAFVGSTVQTITIDPNTANALGTGLTGGLYIDAGISATFVLSSASNIVVGVAQGATAAISVGASSTLQVASSTRAQGAVVVDGTLTVASSAVTSASTLLSVQGSLTTSASASSTSSANSAVNVQSGASLTVQGSVNLNAAVNVATNAFFNFAAAAYFGANVVVAGTVTSATATAVYTQQQASLTLQNGFVVANSVVLDGSSTLTGNGYINGSLTLEATAEVSVGNSPGTVFISGDYNMKSTTRFKLEIASQTSYDSLIITGTANLNGFLTVSLLNNYVPSNGNNFNFLTHRARSGTFSTVTGPIGYLTSFNANYNSAVTTSVTYSSSATAATISFFALMMVVLATLL